MEGAPSRFHVFPQLTKLKLWELPKLKSIYEGTHALEWAALKHFEVSGCREVKILFSSSKLWSCEKKSAQPLFLVDRHKVIFSNLTTLKVSNCDELRFLATFSTTESLVKLTKMEINYCEMIEKIIEMQVGEEVKKDPIVFSQLEYLKFAGLSRLESFCSEYYTLEFPYLKQVMVCWCPNMKIFSQGVERTPMLQKVKLNFGKDDWRWEGDLNSTVQQMFKEMVGFPGCNEFKLSQFSRLKEMWHDQALPVSYFSYLRSLEVDDCTFMRSAIPTNLLPFLNNLTELKVRNCNSVEEVFHLEELNANEPLGKPFPQLSWLHLIDLPKLKKFCNFDGNIIELPKLSFLWIENCPDMVTFVANSTPVQSLFNEKVAFPILKRLKLSKLAKLLHLCEENSHPNNVFQNLRTLETSECCKLEKLVPSWVSFQNLTIMEVSKCDGLINLMTLSTAKSLVRLRTMKVIDCQLIEEIIHVEDGVKEECIVFNELEILGLICLSSLTSFCLGDYAFEFPKLKLVIVKECPKMEIFSRGDLITPNLQRLHLTELDREGQWEGSLNSTIQKLFEEMNAQNSKEED